MERKKKSVGLSALMECNFSDESSEDSDFRIEDHCEESEDDSSVDSEEFGNKYDDVCEEKESGEIDCKTLHVNELLQEAQRQKQKCENLEISKILICFVCLGDDSNDDNEIVECDSCGVTVHEDCYGISENCSVSSSSSTSSTAPWFCQACQAGVADPSCELCPNLGGIFKETDTGKWVHLVCALYISGVTFKDVDKLNNVTLFEMPYNKWSERACSLCSDEQFIHTGVCIRCDAGLCRTYFHVTCGQKEGLLSEACSEEINHADPFYAHCKLHSDKELAKLHKRNWLALQLQMDKRKTQEASGGCINFAKVRNIEDKLQKYQNKYAESKMNRQWPWVPTQKMARPLTSSTSVLRALSRKATLSGMDTQTMAITLAQTNALNDVHRKWHIPPAFNIEYIGYYLDRNTRIESFKHNLAILIEENSTLVEEQKELEANLSQARKDYFSEIQESEKLNSICNIFHEVILKINPNKKLKTFHQTVGFMSKDCPSFALSGNGLNTRVLKLNMNFPCINDQNETTVSLFLTCGICGLTNDQHLLAKCDTCQLNYHLGCLEPPLTRMPKKTKMMGWQCSECDKSSSDSEIDCMDTKSHRQLRHLKANWAKYIKSSKAFNKSGMEREKENCVSNIKASEIPENTAVKTKQSKIKQKIKHEGHAVDSASSSQIIVSQKRKQICTNLETTKMVNGPSSPAKPVVPVWLPQPFAKKMETALIKKVSSSDSYDPLKKQKTSEAEIICNTCSGYGSRAKIVTCDECQKNFHFHCLNPPVKKSPKVRGYSWHCADCDPTESDSE